MSWSVSASGKVEDVRKAIKEQCENQSCIESDGHGFVPALIDGRIAQIGEFIGTEDGQRYGYDGVTVAANGSAWGGGMSLSINVSATKLG